MAKQIRSALLKTFWCQGPFEAVCLIKDKRAQIPSGPEETRNFLN